MPIEDFLLTKHEHKTKLKEAKAATLVSSKAVDDQLQSTFKPKTINFKHKLEKHLQGSGDRAIDLNAKIQKG